VKALKKEIIDNDCSNVAPILCIAQLSEDEAFDKDLKEAYSYATVGGNHSRQAFQEILKEHPEFENKKQYTHRLCSVYIPMDNKLARRLASKHNRATAFCHKMTNWDWVSNLFKCDHDLVYSLSQV